MAQPVLARSGLAVVAVVLVAAVLGIQIANGGGKFEPLQPADACAARPVTSQVEGLEGLTERLVLLGLDGAACRLGLSRERLTLRLARPGPRSEAEIGALREGLLDGVRGMEEDGSLPAPADLADEALAHADLPTWVTALIRAVPDRAINATIEVDDVLVRAIQNLDLRSVLSRLDDTDALNRQLGAAVTDAVQDSLMARVRDLP